MLIRFCVLHNFILVICVISHSYTNYNIDTGLKTTCILMDYRRTCLEGTLFWLFYGTQM